MKKLILAVGILLLSSCGLQVDGEFRGPITGALYTSDGIFLDEFTLINAVDKGARIVSGEELKSIILPPTSILEPQK